MSTLLIYDNVYEQVDMSNFLLLIYDNVYE
jgi:hypothetical protein